MAIDLDLHDGKLRERIGPVLSDGTALRDLIDLDKREVSMRVLNDPQIHRLELQRIFAKGWVGLAHVSEIPNAGDFVLRHIGEDAVIVTRGQDGSVSTLLNVCAHRGMEVCWADEGNQAQFKCPYHGWVFDGTGKLLGAPFEQEMYGDWDKSLYGLRTARTEVRSGVVFASFDQSDATLDEWLGDIGWYVDECNLDDMEVLGSPWRTMAHSNWKSTMDQFAGDGYHTLGVHRAIFELGLLPVDVNKADLKLIGIDIVHVSTPEGHGVFCFNPQNNSQNHIEHELSEADPYGIEGRAFSIEVFPQTVVGGRSEFTLPDGTKVRIGGLTTINPKGQGAYEWRMLDLIDKSAPPEIKKMMQRMNRAQIALIGTDDFEQAPSMQRSARGVVGQEQPLRYNALLGEVKPKSWPGPGTIHAGVGKDDSQWRFWQRWYDLMTADEG
jgi:phenylpropionate dioxygenase-like ring-hydroxylating dioxygenase large terminal subunit